MNMNGFHKTAHKLLNEYKSLLRRQLAPEQMKQRLQELGLDKRLPKNDVELYNLWSQVIAAAEARYKATQPGVRYSGNEKFLSHIKHVFACYSLEGDRVIHVTQTASQAVIEAIQLTALPEARLTTETFDQLDACADVIHKHGSEEQKSIFASALKTHLSRNRNFFLPLLNHFQKHPMLASVIQWGEEEAVA